MMTDHADAADRSGSEPSGYEERIVAPLSDDRPDATTGRVVRQVDENRVLVAWGGQQDTPDPELTEELIDELRPVGKPPLPQPAEADRLRADLAEMTTQRDEWQHAHASAFDGLVAATAERNDARDQVTALHAENEKLRRARDRLKDEAERLHAELRVAGDELERTRADCDENANDLSDMEKDRDRWRNLVKPAAETVAELTSDLDEAHTGITRLGELLEGAVLRGDPAKKLVAEKLCGIIQDERDSLASKGQSPAGAEWGIAVRRLDEAGRAISAMQAEAPQPARNPVRPGRDIRQARRRTGGRGGPQQ